MSKTISAIQHNPFTRIGVTHEVGDEGSGLVVTVYRFGEDKKLSGVPQRYRYWNPAEVTKWFNTHSKAHVDEWRIDYHRSGLGASDFKRPDGNNSDVEIVAPYRAVPYHSQRDNERAPQGSCNVTCCAMALAFFGKKTIERKYAQIEDNLEFYMDKRGLDRHSHGHLSTMMQSHGLDTRFRTGLSLEEIRENLRAGYLAIVSGQFTRSGHIVLCIGIKNGSDFIVHDPWGDFNTRYRDHNGASRIYTDDTMQDVLINRRAGRSPAWAHIVKG